MRLIWQTVGAFLLLVGVVSCGSIALEIRLWERRDWNGLPITPIATSIIKRPAASYVHHLKTAAHRTLPFGTYVKVTNLDNGKSVRVKSMTGVLCARDALSICLNPL